MRPNKIDWQFSGPISKLCCGIQGFYFVFRIFCRDAARSYRVVRWANEKNSSRGSRGSRNFFQTILSHYCWLLRRFRHWFEQSSGGQSLRRRLSLWNKMIKYLSRLFSLCKKSLVKKSGTAQTVPTVPRAALLQNLPTFKVLWQWKISYSTMASMPSFVSHWQKNAKEDYIIKCTLPIQKCLPLICCP